MKLTKLQRYTAYCILLEEVETDIEYLEEYDFGFCWVFENVFDCTDLYERFSIILPELSKRRTRNWIFFFRNWKERIAALKQCIEETHPDR